MDQQLVDRVRDAIKTSHDVGNDWDTIARAAISEVGYHTVGREPHPWSRTTTPENTCKPTPLTQTPADELRTLSNQLARELRAAAEQARRDFEESTQ